MKRSDYDTGSNPQFRPAWKLGIATAALALFMPLGAMAQTYICDSGITMDADGEEPFFVNEAIPIILTLKAETVSETIGEVSTDGILHINSFDYKPDCQDGTDFNTCVAAGNTVVIATPDAEIGGSCGAEFSTSPIDAETIQFVPTAPIALDANSECTVEFDIMVSSAASGTTSIIEASGWASSQIACFTPPPESVEYPPLASSSASAQLSFDLSTERAEFRVTKYFSDMNPDDTADVHIQCNAGLPLSSDFTLGHGEMVTFVVKDFRPGTMDCKVWEGPIPSGYTPDYAAGELGGTAGGIAADADGCQFTEVSTGIFTCDVTNNVDEVVITVNKSWTEGITEIELEAEAKYSCYDVFTSADGAGGIIDVQGTLFFEGVYDSEIIDGLYPATPDSYCTVTEVDVPDWITADTSDCDRVPVQAGAECTLYNIAFYEGIPTLSQYGMALMALLMLGMGAVAYRRFA